MECEGSGYGYPAGVLRRLMPDACSAKALSPLSGPAMHEALNARYRGQAWGAGQELAPRWVHLQAGPPGAERAFGTAAVYARVQKKARVSPERRGPRGSNVIRGVKCSGQRARQASPAVPPPRLPLSYREIGDKVRRGTGPACRSEYRPHTATTEKSLRREPEWNKAQAYSSGEFGKDRYYTAARGHWRRKKRPAPW